MGTTLTGTTPQDTYDSLIKVTDNGPLSGTLKALSDGLGNDSTLSLSTTAASIAGTLAVSGNATFDTSTLVVDAANNRVGVGTASPSVILDVVSAANGIIRVKGGTATNEGGSFFVQNAGDANTLAAFGDRARFFGGTPDQLVSCTSSVPLTFDVNGVERMRITSAGVLDLVSGQLKFPATQVASADVNTLDDYEEGTWTPTVTFDGASVGVTYGASNSGTYTKVGRKVSINGYLDVSNKGTSTGTAQISNLPFTIGSGASNYGAPSFRPVSISFADMFIGYGDVNGTTITLQEVTNAGAVSGLTDADFATSVNIIFSFTYFV
jgi:hypothetical protein